MRVPVKPSFEDFVRHIGHHPCYADDQLPLLYKAACMSIPLRGDAAEFGVYQGATAAGLATLFPDRILWLFDTFAGMPAWDPSIDSHPAGDFSDTTLDDVRKRLGGKGNPWLVAGHFPASVEDARAWPYFETGHICFAHIDFDQYQSTLDALKWVWPRLTPGGSIVLHDYGRARCKGVAKAMREFFEEGGDKSILLRETTGISGGREIAIVRKAVDLSF